MGSLIALSDELCSKMERNSDSPPRDFLTDASIEKIVTAATVERCIEESKVEVMKRQDCIDTVLSGGKKVFTVLVLIKKVELMADFVERDGSVQEFHLDSRLPLQYEELLGMVKGAGRVTHAKDFETRQWEVLTPFFRIDRTHRLLSIRKIMPFTVCRELAEGGFGLAYVVQLPEGHHGFGTRFGVPVQLVRKTIKFVSEEQDRKRLFENEDRILTLLRTLRHLNIIELLVSYTVSTADGAQHNLLFPKADCSLADLLQGKSDKSWSQHFADDVAMVHQLYGLSSAINSLHNFVHEKSHMALIGCHYDLKPDNILVKNGCLLLADFGLSRLRPDNSKSIHKAGEGHYTAPESEVLEGDGFGHGLQSRPSDMWSFGCIVLEIVTFIKGGSESVKDLNKARRFTGKTGNPKITTSTFHASGNENEKVTEWINNQRSLFDENWNRIFELIRALLSIDPLARPVAEVVAQGMFIQEMRLIVKSCCHNFESLAKEHATLEFKVERERFIILSWGASLLPPGPHYWANSLKNPPDWLDGRPLGSLGEIRRLFLAVEDDLKQLATISDHSRAAWPIYTDLQSNVQELWLYQGDEDQFQERVQERLLQEDESATSLEDMRSWPSKGTRYTDIARLKAIRYMTAVIENDRKNFSEIPGKKLRLDYQVDYVLRGAHYFGQITLNGKESQVLIERMSYNPSWGDLHNKELYKRVGKWATLLNVTKPKSWKVLECVGFFHEPIYHRFGLAYEFPKDKATAPIDLKRLIETCQRPVLGQVFKLAYSITLTLLNIHKANWLHKNLSAQNILFFDSRLTSAVSATPQPRGRDHGAVPFRDSSSSPAHDSKQTRKKKGFHIFSQRSRSQSKNPVTSAANPHASRSPDAQLSGKASESNPGNKEYRKPVIDPKINLKNAYIVGFDHARESRATVFTGGGSQAPSQVLYQHPEYREKLTHERFRRQYDYFSIGLVLLEIGLWKTLEHLGPFMPDKSEPSKTYEDAMLRLGAIMGVKYQNAVTACLDGSLKSDDNESSIEEKADESAGTKTRAPWVDFEDVVVTVIKSCSA